MKAGNVVYRNGADIEPVVPIFPLAEALLLPGGQLPLNIFEPRYTAMIDHVLSGNRLVGLVQPRLSGATEAANVPDLCAVGGLGRLVSFAETGQGHYMVALHGICRFRIAEELAVSTPFRQCRIEPFLDDLEGEGKAEDIDREAVLEAFRAYLDANGLEADWESVDAAGDASLVNALSMMAPYGAAEKQALLEAPDLRTRAETLIALTEMVLAQKDGGTERIIQ